MNRAVVAIAAMLAIAGSAVAGIEIHAAFTIPTTGESHAVDAWANETGEFNATADDQSVTNAAVGGPVVPELPSAPAPPAPAVPELPATPELPSAPELPATPGVPAVPEPGVPVPPALPEPSVPEAPEVPALPEPEAPSAPETPLLPTVSPPSADEATQIVMDLVATVEGAIPAAP